MDRQALQSTWGHKPKQTPSLCPQLIRHNYHSVNDSVVSCGSPSQPTLYLSPHWLIPPSLPLTFSHQDIHKDCVTIMRIGFSSDSFRGTQCKSVKPAINLALHCLEELLAYFKEFSVENPAVVWIQFWRPAHSDKNMIWGIKVQVFSAPFLNSIHTLLVLQP